MKVLTKEQEEWAYDKWCVGYSHEEIAIALFVSPKTIDKTLCNKIKVKPTLICEWKDKRRKCDKLTRSQRLWVIQKWNEGYTQKEIAEASGIRAASISRLLRFRMRDHAELKWEGGIEMDEDMRNALMTAISPEGIAAIVKECEKQPSRGEDTCGKCRYRILKDGKKIHSCVFSLCPMEWEV